MKASRLIGVPVLLAMLLGTTPTAAQDLPARAVRSANHPLPSLRKAVEDSRRTPPPFTGMVRTVPNRPFTPDTRAVTGAGETAGPVQTALTGSATATNSFDGADNDDNGAVTGYRYAPPDTEGDVGGGYFIQMLNAITTVFNQDGTVAFGPFASSEFWRGMSGSEAALTCANNNRGDAIVMYDEAAERWVFSQFAFPTTAGGNLSAPFVQCVAVSMTSDPMYGWFRYAFDMTSYGFNDYPKLGITSGAITYMANIFLMPFGWFGGTYIGAMEKDAMYAGQPAWLLGNTIGLAEFGFVAGDLDDPAGTAGFVPALFATAMSRSGYFDIWSVNPNFASGSGTLGRIASIPIPTYDNDFCSASREACIPQPSPGEDLEAMSDRLMQRLAIRDYGGHRSMVASHAIDVGGGRAGVRWYEMRETGGNWSMHQMGTYAPNDGLNRWMPSVAMNAAGDIGLGYLVSSSTHFLSVGVAGQSAANSGAGVLDSDETLCAVGTGAQTQTGRAGDYSETVVDPVTDRFWHTNEYGRVTGNFEWATRVCEFSVQAGEPPPPPPPPPDPTTMAVAAIATGSYSADRGKKGGAATVTVLSDVGTPVEGALVTGDFGGDFVEPGISGLTGADGTATLQTEGTAKFKGEPSVSFCVSDVTGSLVYVPGDNASPSFACAPVVEGTEVSVVSITTGQTGVGQGRKAGTASVQVLDDQGNPAGGYTVIGDFSGDIAETGVSAVTASNGVATLQTVGTATGNVTVEFCVADVVGSLPYVGGVPCSFSVAGKGATTTQSVDGLANYPNPFNPSTVITWSVASESHVTLRVFDVLGREVALLVDGVQQPGSHRATFDASRLPAGLYLAVLEGAGQRTVRRMTLLK